MGSEGNLFLQPFPWVWIASGNEWALQIQGTVEICLFEVEENQEHIEVLETFTAYL